HFAAISSREPTWMNERPGKRREGPRVSQQSGEGEQKKPERRRGRSAIATMVSAAAAPPRTVMITGVSRGLGRALALELARRDHTIIGCARSQENLSSLQAEVAAASPPGTTPPKHFFTAVDVRSDSSVRELAKVLAEAKQVPDIIGSGVLGVVCFSYSAEKEKLFSPVNNAGTINKNNKIWEVPPEEFDTVIDTNVKGTTNVLRHFLPLMIEKKQGIVVNVSSSWGRSAAAEVAPYCASKWAVEGLTRSVAKELPPGIAAVALSPGVVNTDMLASCFGSSASLYQTPEAWAPKAANMILNLTTLDNGASLTV
ncbi:hypothetical protein Taro_040188, partial [Colocasia esculenta]|nr:hypothetical protein [Colocasia esculenta]